MRLVEAAIAPRRNACSAMKARARPSGANPASAMMPSTCSIWAMALGPMVAVEGLAAATP
jgi:hypothetical protein